MKVWYDITNTPQVHLLLAIERIIEEINCDTVSLYTAREFSETVKMLAQRVGKENYLSIGSYHGKSYLNKVFGLFSRFSELKRASLDYDLSISCGSEGAVWKAWMERKKSIAFGDNDQARQWTYGHLVDYALFPNAIPESILAKQGLKGKFYLYNGFKEDLYLAYYKPDQSFLTTLPFEHYVVVRPENVKANYIRNGSVKSITPKLLKMLSAAGNSILYLPRYDEDRCYAEGVGNVYIPNAPVNGLDACYFADAVLTGAGTFAREAACLGVPSFSFFAGKEMLSVDKKMIRDGKMFFSRTVSDLMSAYMNSQKEVPDLHRCLFVKEEVKSVLSDLIVKWGMQ